MENKEQQNGNENNDFDVVSGIFGLIKLGVAIWLIITCLKILL